MEEPIRRKTQTMRQQQQIHLNKGAAARLGANAPADVSDAGGQRRRHGCSLCTKTTEEENDEVGRVAFTDLQGKTVNNSSGEEVTTASH